MALSFFLQSFIQKKKYQNILCLCQLLFRQRIKGVKSTKTLCDLLSYALVQEMTQPVIT